AVRRGGAGGGRLDGSEVGAVIEVSTRRMKETSAVTSISVRPWVKPVMAQLGGGLLQRGGRDVVSFIAHLCRRELPDERAKLTSAQRRELEAWESFQALIELNRQFNCDAAQFPQDAKGAKRIAQSLDSLFTDRA